MSNRFLKYFVPQKVTSISHSSVSELDIISGFSKLNWMNIESLLYSTRSYVNSMGTSWSPYLGCTAISRALTILSNSWYLPSFDLNMTSSSTEPWLWRRRRRFWSSFEISRATRDGGISYISGGGYITSVQPISIIPVGEKSTMYGIGYLYFRSNGFLSFRSNCENL